MTDTLPTGCEKCGWPAKDRVHHGVSIVVSGAAVAPHDFVPRAAIDRIEPALSAEEWATVSEGALLRYVDPPPVVVGDDAICYFLDGRLHFATHEGNAIAVVDEPAKLLALANAALPDSDPRKITCERVAAIRHSRLAYPEGSASWRELTALADALASYLPPEEP